eukprot:3480411-Pyramimonas_sp.AAC.1
MPKEPQPINSRTKYPAACGNPATVPLQQRCRKESGTGREFNLVFVGAVGRRSMPRPEAVQEFGRVVISTWFCPRGMEEDEER